MVFHAVSVDSGKYRTQLRAGVFAVAAHETAAFQPVHVLSRSTDMLLTTLPINHDTTRLAARAAPVPRSRRMGRAMPTDTLIPGLALLWLAAGATFALLAPNLLWSRAAGLSALFWLIAAPLIDLVWLKRKALFAHIAQILPRRSVRGQARRLARPR
ncbi:hypothetical protein [Dokdonella sp.]|uniref:hypothetical protein n=1 Tax=Dokdonella sp. TaxID=2291710 RepID=UPI0025BBCC61|nr:hypothetical protein [Dokdonella sp.]